MSKQTIPNSNGAYIENVVVGSWGKIKSSKLPEEFLDDDIPQFSDGTILQLSDGGILQFSDGGILQFSDSVDPVDPPSLFDGIVLQFSDNTVLQFGDTILASKEQ